MIGVRVPARASASRCDGWRSAMRRALVVCCAGGVVGLASAQGVGEGSATPPSPVGPPERSLAEWLVRLQQASRVPSYVGTFVVLSGSGGMSSSRIWHACEGDVQAERVDTLSGPPRSTFRRNGSVVTFLLDARTVRMDERESAGVFPNLLSSTNVSAVVDFYSAREVGNGRVAGFDADVVQLVPRDDLRYGYRIWSERQTGLVIKTQTLDNKARVLEQAAFSELQLNAPVQVSKLSKMMARTHGYKVETVDRTRTTADAEGWMLASPVAGFASQNCYRRASASAGQVVQWIFSDGLATVSLFLEPFNAERHSFEGVASMGATHALTKRVADRSRTWWVTAVGEVPPQTLHAFVSALKRKR